MLNAPVVSVLGKDPRRTHRINANSFQQNAISTVNGWQYAAFYTDSSKGGTTSSSSNSGSCYVNLARRQHLPSTGFQQDGAWETLTFEDYEQWADDGHNTISVGICKGDGTIHLAFDHHCDRLRFRISEPGVALQSSSHGWRTDLFTEVQHELPGIPSNDLTNNVTYPTFVNADNDLLLTYRIGKAGLGSDIIYRYSATTHVYTYLGQHLTGVSNNPYTNGIDYRLSRLHTSWCYRNIVEEPPNLTPDAHRQQAGPNGPENNQDLNYAYSDDLGETWKSSAGNVIAKLGSKDEAEATIKPGAVGARVFDIPMGSGILNSEAQTADWEGGFLALNRENRSGEEKWMLYYRDRAANWTSTEVPSVSQPTETGSRASVGVDRKNNLYLVLPGNTDSSLSVVRARQTESYSKFENVWIGKGYDGEPLIDVQLLDESAILSVFTRTDIVDGERDVVVLDFILDEVGPNP